MVRWNIVARSDAPIRSAAPSTVRRLAMSSRPMIVDNKTLPIVLRTGGDAGHH